MQGILSVKCVGSGKIITVKQPKINVKKNSFENNGSSRPESAQHHRGGMQIEWSNFKYIHTSTSFLLFQNGSFCTFELGKNTRTKTSFLFIPTIYNYYYIVMRKKVILLHHSSE